MANWLEAEEHKLEAEEQERSLLFQTEEAVHRQLATFYGLCERVNRVRPASLWVRRLKIEGRRTYTIEETEYGPRTIRGITGNRGIRISCPNQNETFIDAFIHEIHVNFDVDSPLEEDLSLERVVIRKTCALQDLLDWREDQILLAIQWMMLESEAIEDSIPGTEVMNDLAAAQAQKAKPEASAKRRAIEAEAKRVEKAEAQRRALKAAARARTLWLLFIGCSAAGIAILLVFYFFRPTLGEDEAYVRIGPGVFNMGCSPDDGECDADEKPVHQVRISRAYEIGKYEVTQRQWEAVMGSNPSQFKGTTLPVAQVSWQDVHIFLGRLNARSHGHRHRLPTEAEWEYAARGGTTGKHAGPLDSVAWYNGNTGHWYSIGFGWFGWQTHDVGQKLPNGYGLYDMQGNAWEFCEDWYSEKYYGVGPIEDPKGPSSGIHRVVRGGSWYNAAKLLRVSQRLDVDPDGRQGVTIGFRIVRD